MRRGRARRAVPCGRAPGRARAAPPASRHRRAATMPAPARRDRRARPGDAACAARRRSSAISPVRASVGSSHSGNAGTRSRAAAMVRRSACAVRPFGERIDRLDRRHVRELGLRDHEVRMHHLQHAVVHRHGARHDAALADRQQALDVILAGIEIGDDDVAGAVARIDEIGRARPVRRGRAMPVDRHRDGDDAAGHDIAQHRPRPPVDGTGRQVQQEIDDARRLLAAEQPAVEPRDLVADPRQHRDRREQGIENTGTHRCSLWHARGVGQRADVLSFVCANRSVVSRSPARTTRDADFDPLEVARASETSASDQTIQYQTSLSRDVIGLQQTCAVQSCTNLRNKTSRITGGSL